MTPAKFQILIALVIALLIFGGLGLICHPQWNFPSSYGYDSAGFWKSEWGQRMVANYIVGGVIFASGVLAALYILLVHMPALIRR